MKIKTWQILGIIFLLSFKIIPVKSQTSQLYFNTINFSYFNSTSCLWSMNLNGSNLLLRYNFSENGNIVVASNLLLKNNHFLYGASITGGNNNCGFIFSYDFLTDTIIKEYDFDSTFLLNNSSYCFLDINDSIIIGLNKTGGLYNAGFFISY